MHPVITTILISAIVLAISLVAHFLLQARRESRCWTA